MSAYLIVVHKITGQASGIRQQSCPNNCQVRRPIPDEKWQPSCSRNTQLAAGSGHHLRVSRYGGAGHMVYLAEYQPLIALRQAAVDMNKDMMMAVDGV